MADRCLIVPPAHAHQQPTMNDQMMQYPSSTIPYVLKENVHQPQSIPSPENLVKYHISCKIVGHDFVWFIHPIEYFLYPPTNVTRIYPVRYEKVYNQKLNVILTHPVTFYETVESEMAKINRFGLPPGVTVQQQQHPVNVNVNANINQSRQIDASTETVLHISPNSTTLTWKKSPSPDFQSFRENLESNQASPFLNFSSDKVWRYANDSLLLRSSTPDSKNKKNTEGGGADNKKPDEEDCVVEVVDEDKKETETKDTTVQTDDWEDPKTKDSKVQTDDWEVPEHPKQEALNGSYANVVQKNLATLKIENDKQSEMEHKSTQVSKKYLYPKFKANKQSKSQVDQNHQQETNNFDPYKRKFTPRNPASGSNNLRNGNSGSSNYNPRNNGTSDYNSRNAGSNNNNPRNSGTGSSNYNSKNAGTSNYNSRNGNTGTSNYNSRNAGLRNYNPRNNGPSSYNSRNNGPGSSNYNPNSHSRMIVNTNYRQQQRSNDMVEKHGKGDFSYNKKKQPYDNKKTDDTNIKKPDNDAPPAYEDWD